MNPLTGIVAILVPWLLGFALLRGLGLRLREDRLASAGYSYVAGTFATGLVVLGWFAAGLPLSPVLLNGVLVGACVALWVLRRRRSLAAAPEPATDPESPWSRSPAWQRAVFWAAVVVALAVVCDRAMLTNLRPIMDGDEVFIWAPRAKVLFHAGGLNDRFKTEMLESVAGAADVVSHKDYPLLNSLLHALAFVDAGRITNLENRLPIQAFGLALVLIAAAALRRLANPLVAAALLAMLVSEAPIAYGFRLSVADGMAGLGLLCAADCLLRHVAGGPPWAPLGGLSLGFLAWSKHEGAMLAAFVAVLVLVFARRRAVAWLAPPAAIIALTWAINAHFGFRNDIVQTGTDEGTIWTRLLSGFGPRGAQILEWFWWDYAGSPAASRLLLFPLVVFLFHPAVRVRRVLFAVGLLLVAAVCAYLWIFAATPRSFAWHWSTAGVRVLSQLNPAIALAVGAMAGAVLRDLFSPDRRL